MKSLILLLAIVLTAGLCRADNIKITTKTITEKDTKKRYSINVEYPFVENIDNPAGGEVINKRINTYVEALVDAFRKDMLDWEAPADLEFSSEYEIKYTVENSDNGILSLKLFNYSYYAGAAHPNSMVMTLNYDISNGSVITLGDLFIPGSDYLNVLSKSSAKDLLRQGSESEIEPEMWWFEEGLAPVEKNFNVFNISNDSLAITFNPYQIGPYAIGMWEVKIPYTELSGVLNTSGIMGKVIR